MTFNVSYGQIQVDVVVYHALTPNQEDAGPNPQQIGSCFSRFPLQSTKNRMCEAEAVFLDHGIDLDFCYRVICDADLFSGATSFSTDEHDPNAINIYVTDGGFTAVPFVGSNRVNFPQPNPGREDQLIHELGHVLGLAHTDEYSWNLLPGMVWQSTAIIGEDNLGFEFGITDTYPSPTDNNGGDAPMSFPPKSTDAVELINCDYVIKPQWSLIDANGTPILYDNGPEEIAMLRNPMEQRMCDPLTFTPQSVVMMHSLATAYQNGAYAGGDCFPSADPLPVLAGTIKSGEDVRIQEPMGVSGELVVEGTLRLILQNYAMLPGSSIRVKGGGQLIVWAASLDNGEGTCPATSGAWEGIFVEPGGTASIYGSTIANARIGITADDPELLDIHNCGIERSRKILIENAVAGSALIKASVIDNTLIEVNSSVASLSSNHYQKQNSSSFGLTISSSTVDIDGVYYSGGFENYSTDISENSDVTIMNQLYMGSSRVEAHGGDLSMTGVIVESFLPTRPFANVSVCDAEFNNNTFFINDVQDAIRMRSGSTGPILGNYFDSHGGGFPINIMFSDADEVMCNIFDNSPSDPDISLTSGSSAIFGTSGNNAGNKFFDGQGSEGIVTNSSINYFHGLSQEEDINEVGFFGSVNAIPEPDGECTDGFGAVWDWDNPDCQPERDEEGNTTSAANEDRSCCKRIIRIWVGCPGSRLYNQRMKFVERLETRFPGCVDTRSFCHENEQEFQGNETEYMNELAIALGETETEILDVNSEIANDKVDADFEVYPNPVTTTVTVEISGYDVTEIYSGQIFDATGVLVKSFTPSASIEKLNLDVADGMYSISIFKGNSLLNVKRFVVIK